MRSIWKRAAALGLCCALSLGMVPSAGAEETTPPSPTVADWKFEQRYAEGAIDDGSLIIKDQSGRENHLELQLYKDSQPTEDTSAADWTEYLRFSEDSMTGADAGSLLFSGDSTKNAAVGADFVTVDGAPVNSETFEDGYTIEFVYRFPEDWTAADSWMGLMARQVTDPSTVSGMDEPQLGSMSVAVSNCKEIQFLTAPAADNHRMSSAAWSVSMDEGGVWYHIAITSDNHTIRTFINGCEAFRDYVSDDMVGLFADETDGRIRIGSSWWQENSQTLDKFLQGNLQEVRLSSGALERENWLIPNPEDYLGDYGSNSTYALKNPDNYNIVLLPDTQNTVEFRGDVMEKAIEGLIDTADELNVEGVIHLGDVVDNVDDTQYQTARAAFYQLPEAGVRYLSQLGNHDGWASGIANYWNSFSANSVAFMNRTADYLTNDSPSGNSSYMFVRAGSYDYLVISLSAKGGGSTAWDSSDEAWLKNVLEQYPQCPTIVTSHDIQNCSDTEPSAVKLSKQGKALWEIVKSYDQVFLLAGGHSHGAGVEVLTNANGKEVFSILTDYQFAYNGGNGFFRYLEFDEGADKLYYSTYSPYAASLNESEKGFFDVNFMTGAGNEGELALPFSTRFAGMERQETAIPTEGRWVSGEYHTHTIQSNDASESFMTAENVLNAAFREDTEHCAAATLDFGRAFDFLMLTDHLRNSPRDPNGTAKVTARWVAIANQQREIEKLQIQGKYDGKLIYSGFEWDMMGLDHASVGIVDESGEVPVDAIHAFEWLYSYDSKDEVFTDNEAETYGPRQNTKTDVEKTYAALRWLEENYPDSFVLPNHPSRHNGDATGVVTAEVLRKMNDIAPNIVFGMEGMPGNQMAASKNRAELSDIYGGADVMISEVGGVWDSLLGEGRRFFNFTNSDFHFKVSSNGNYSSGYWPSEYARNYTWMEGNTFADVVDGLRSGKSYAVYGDLIDGLDFSASSGQASADMGGELTVKQGDTVTLSIRFQVPQNNNYAPISGDGSGVSNVPVVDHIDLISGKVTGKLPESEYSTTTNDTTAVVRTFTKADWGQPDSKGWYTVSVTVPADSDRYYRLRGTNLAPDTAGYTDANGNPLQDQSFDGVSDNSTRFNSINDRNYTGLWFYSNPIFVSAEARTDGFVNDSALPMELVGRYTSGGFSVDGGVMEIVAYNTANKHAYAVNGQTGKLAVIPMSELGKSEGVTALTATEFDVKAAVAAKDKGFVYGDMTSVAVSPDGSTLAVALQAEGYADPGRGAFFTCKSDGSLVLKGLATTGVQPDMIVFADGATALTADEGEPREGYGDAAIDPKGSVTVIDLSDFTADVVDFTQYDSVAARQSLVEGKVLLKKNTAPSVDLEPEYIALSGGKAYVSLQEANAIAVLDIGAKRFTGVYSVGFEDYGTTPVDVDKSDAAYNPKTYSGLLGIRMPDGIDTFTAGGKTYLVTANEGDSRDWNGYLNEDEKGKNKPSPNGNIAANTVGGKVVYFLASDYDGLESGKDYLFGGRTFTIFEVGDSGLREVYTSGSDFESKTAQYLPAYFNVSNDNVELDNRSGKKGPEPESVTIGAVDGRTYAFVALERTGGIMAYEVTDPAKTSFVNYINTRDFTKTVPGSADGDKFVTGGDVAPEGLKFLPASQSPTGYPLLLAACEVSGTVAVYQTGTEYVNPNPSPSTGSGSSPDTSTKTVTNPDGSTTKTVTNRKTGVVTITTTYQNGAKVVTTVPKEGEALSKITVPQGKTAPVTVPATATKPGTVAVIVHADGTEEVIKTSVATENGIRFFAKGDLTVKLRDNSKSFSDVTAGSWAADAVQFATSRELFAGTGKDTFAPTAEMSRAMLLTVLARLDGQDTTAGERWDSVGLSWAKEQGISDGVASQSGITREQLSVMLYRYAKAEKVEADFKEFSDADRVSDWAVEAMGWSVKSGIIHGKNATLDPQGVATRAEVAAMLQRFVSLLVK